jgi:DNA topoisomerase III
MFFRGYSRFKYIVEKLFRNDGKQDPAAQKIYGRSINCIAENPGKYVEDKELEKTLSKTEGLGTEATRAEFITKFK